MRRSITATLATAAIIATGVAAVAVPLTDAVTTGTAEVTVTADDDPVDPINPTPPTPADPLVGETPTPGAPDQGTPDADAVDPGTPAPAPDPAPADPGAGEQPAPGDTDNNAPQDGAGQTEAPAPAEPEATPSPAPAEPRVDTSTVADIAPGSYTEGEAAPAGHAFVAATDTGYEVVHSYRPGVQLAKTGADGTILVALVAILLGGVGIAGAAFARKRRASTR